MQDIKTKPKYLYSSLSNIINKDAKKQPKIKGREKMKYYNLEKIIKELEPMDADAREAYLLKLGFIIIE